MEKIILIILILTFNFVNAQCGIAYDYDHKNFSDLEKRNLKGKIETVTYSHFEIQDKFGELSKGAKKCEQVLLFNSNGTVRKIMEYNSKGKLTSVDIHEYKNGEIQLISHYSGEGELIAKTAFVQEGNNVREQRYIANGELNSQYFIRAYDTNNNMLKEVWKEHKDTSDINEYHNYFDKGNRLIKIKTGSYSTQISYENDNSKFPVKVEYINPQTQKVYRIKSYVFDENGSVLREILNDTVLRSYEYTYDDQGNWIKEVHFKTEAKIPEELTVRKITYFQ